MTTGFMRFLGVVFGATALGCSSNDVQIYNETDSDVVVKVGDKEARVALSWPRATLSGKFKPGTKVIATAGGDVVDEATIPEGSKGKTLIYNVKGEGDLYLVDYFNCYAEEGSESPRGDEPFEIVASLKGTQIFVAPGGVVVEHTGAFPRSVAKGTHVMRVEHVPPSLATQGVENYILQTLQTDLKMRGGLYFH